MVSPLNADTPDAEERSIWNARAERVAQQVLDEVIDGLDAIPATSLLMAVLRAEAGELDAEEVAGLDGYFRREENPEADCTCPPDLLERGGYRGNCPVHSLTGRTGIVTQASSGKGSSDGN
jgi:hypothetical protein